MATAKGILSKPKSIFSNHSQIADITAKLVITFGVVLIIGGLYLMVANPDVSAYVLQPSQGSNTITLSVIEWVPGLPFLIGGLSSVGAVVAGSVYWIVGIDLLLIGLGLWARHRFAQLAGGLIFTIAAFFQFVQFLLNGVLGAPMSVVCLLVNAVLAYLLFFRFEADTTSDQAIPPILRRLLNR